MGDNSSPDKNFKKKLIDNVKKEVKQIMEEAVTKKFVHEDSSSVTSLCAAVEACLSQGLRRRALGLFKTSSTTALLHKVAKNFAPAEVVSRRVQEIENADPTRRSSSSGDSTSRPAKPPLQKKNSSGAVLASPRYLWIRLALFEKHLAKIIDHLVQNSNKYYEKDSLVADPDYGSILSSLLVGPCALDFSRTKTQDHYWTDPPADELVQRHRISSGHNTPPAGRRPALNFRRSLHGVSSEEGMRQAPKDYVESLHQNNRATLLYGKNNVLVMPQKDLAQAMPGYLSLHQTYNSLTIKWTPNQLMNGYAEAEDKDKSIYWDYAMNVKVDEIVYVHCHQQAGDNGGTVVLVGQDGVQRPPIHFPKGGHLLAFLSCLETGLLPRGQLDPPLWSQRGKASVAELREEQEEQEGKVFPKLRRRGRNTPTTRLAEDADESTDYVFRIVSKSSHEDFLAGQDLLEPRSWTDAVGQALGQGASQARGRMRAALASTSTASSTSSSKSLSLEPSISLSAGSAGSQASQDPPHTPKLTTGDSIQLVCDTMKRQIISRAFYGWLAYCRHLRTVRTHLSGLVSPCIVSADEPNDARAGVTPERWAQLDCREELLRLAYFGGVCHDIRKQVWPYLLGHYVFGSTADDRRTLDATTRQSYETTMSEWLAVEAIVRQRDKETMAANLAKLSSESTSGEAPPPTPNLQHDLSNDVFEDNVSLSDDDNDPVVVDGEEAAGQNDSQDTSDAPDSLATAAAAAATVAAAPTGAEVSSSAAVAAAAAGAVAVSVAPPASAEGETEDVDQPEAEESAGVETSSPTAESVEPETAEESVEQAAAAPEQAEAEAVVPAEQSADPAAPAAAGEGQQAEQQVEQQVEQQMEQQAEAAEDLTEAANLAAEAQDLAEAPLINYAAAKIVMTKPSVDAFPEAERTEDTTNKLAGTSQGNRSNCVSPASSQGGVYSTELLETFGLNIHRIDKDVQRCDRNYWYFTTDNLEKLRNVMCTYVWEHLDIGYMQGMCDLVAPLLVILDDESCTYACFCRLMDRMGANFPNGGAMDTHFANMRSLIQILDSEMFELMHQNGDYTHFYFCYRWFLLDFKRELLYDDVFSTWETIWAAQHVASSNFVLFIALALVQTYRDIILSNSMDFTDIIKFFNEMAERHDAKAVLALARDLVLQLQTLIENK